MSNDEWQEHLRSLCDKELLKESEDFDYVLDSVDEEDYNNMEDDIKKEKK